MYGRVDPRPVKPPALGLLASANIVTEGGDYLLDEYQPDDGLSDVENASNAAGPRQLIPGASPNADYEQTSDGSLVHWVQGFAYRPEVCNGGDIIAVDSAAPGVPPTAEDEIQVTPYIVEGIDERSTFGTPHDPQLLEGRQYARRQLLACQSKQIERELWTGKLTTGALTGNAHLTDANVTLPEGSRMLGYLTALAVLEQAINDGTCGQQGMIHARSDLISLWNAGGALRRVGNLILTIHDSIVVPGSGYDGSAPVQPDNEVDPNESTRLRSADGSWAYATTVVDVRLGAFFNAEHVAERLDKTNNLLTTHERRFAAATWGCLQVGVLADHVNSITQTGS
jgi:hypothetical protein